MTLSSQKVGKPQYHFNKCTLGT